MRTVFAAAGLTTVLAGGPAFALCEPNPNMMRAMGHMMAAGNGQATAAMQAHVQAEMQRCMWEYDRQRATAAMPAISRRPSGLSVSIPMIATMQGDGVENELLLFGRVGSDDQTQASAEFQPAR